MDDAVSFHCSSSQALGVRAASRLKFKVTCFDFFFF